MTRTVLTLDDDPSAAEFAAETLREANIPAIAESNVFRALELVTKEMIQVVVVDLHMPIMAGTSVLQWMRDHAPFTRCVMVTGFANLTELLECWRLGARGCVLKHNNFADDLVAAVGTTLNELDGWDRALQTVREAVRA